MTFFWKQKNPGYRQISISSYFSIWDSEKCIFSFAKTGNIAFFKNTHSGISCSESLQKPCPLAIFSCAFPGWSQETPQYVFRAPSGCHHLRHVLETQMTVLDTIYLKKSMQSSGIGKQFSYTQETWHLLPYKPTPMLSIPTISQHTNEPSSKENLGKETNLAVFQSSQCSGLTHDIL